MVGGAGGMTEILSERNERDGRSGEREPIQQELAQDNHAQLVSSRV